MPKIQGKQIANSTITQSNLNLTTPLSTELSSAATVDYVNTHIDEMVLLLAPAKPVDSWTNKFSSLTITSALYQTGRALTTGTAVSNITLSTTPTFSITSTVGTLSPAQTTAVALPSSGSRTFVLSDGGSTLETEVITSSSTSNASGYIRYTTGDPYVGLSGKAGFWNGIVTFTVNGTLPSITPSASQRTLQLTHPGTDSPEIFLYYVDSVSTPSVSTPTITTPTMSSYVSGVPTLTSGQSVTGVAFTITNAVSYFYNNSMWDVSGSYVNATSSAGPTSIPTTPGQTVSESDKTVTVKTGTGGTGVFSDTSWGFTITARNIAGNTGSGAYSSNALRVDTVSIETERILSGSGSYPESGYGGPYDSKQSLLSGVYVNELQLRNGLYTYPTVNYSTNFSNPSGSLNYSTATGTRWATFNIGTFTNNSAFTLNFIGSTGISSIYGQANLLVEVKIDGSSYWVDGDSAYVVGTNPGSSVDGPRAAVVVGSSPSATSRRITFGSITYSGNIIVRVGLTDPGVSFTGLTATSIS